jgi:hypothetical protein
MEMNTFEHVRLHTSPLYPRVLILGSCVSRDIFRINQDSQFVVAGYYARSSFASAFHPIVLWDEWSMNLSSSYQRQMVHADICKRWPGMIKDTQYGLCLVDFIDERFHLAQLRNGGIVSISNEIKSAGFDRKKNRARIIKSFSDEHYNLWETDWARFVCLLKQLNKLKCLCLNKLYWAPQVQSGTLEKEGNGGGGHSKPDRYGKYLFGSII